jgi:hypothetical protein
VVAKVVALLIFVCSAAHAESRCSVEAVRSRAAELLGKLPTIPIEVDAQRVTGRVVDDSGTRTVTARDCAELVESMALVVVMVTRASPPVITPAISHPFVIEQQPETPPPPVASASRSGAQISLLAGLASGFSSHPVALRGSFGARLRRDRLGIELAANYDHVESTTAGSGSVEVTMLSATLAPCLHASRAVFCATATGGLLTGMGRQLDDLRTRRLLYLAAGGRAGWEVPVLGSATLRLSADVAIPLIRNQFQVDGMTAWSSHGVELWFGGTILVLIP